MGPYTYDGAGRLTNHVVNGQTRTFDYNFQGRMTSLTDIDSSVFAYEFDGEGNRLSQSLNDCLSKRFVYDGADVLLELNPANGVAYAWVNGPGIDQPIERLLFIDGEPRARRVFHADALGSIAALSDPSGRVTQTYTYAAFGSIRHKTGPDPNRVTYTAREHLGDSQGWMYYRHRVYAPCHGRFGSQDLLNVLQEKNNYVYVGNRTVLWNDYWGLTERDNSDVYRYRYHNHFPWFIGHIIVEIETPRYSFTYELSAWQESINTNIITAINSALGYNVPGYWVSGGRPLLAIACPWQDISAQQADDLLQSFQLLCSLDSVGYNFYSRNSWNTPIRIVEDVLQNGPIDLSLRIQEPR